MRTIRFIIRKEFQQIRRDKRLLPLIFLSPVLQIALLGYAANMDVKDIPLAICDQDHTVESRGLVTSFLESGSHVASAYVPDASDAEQSIEDGKSSLALVIPPGFGRSLSGQKARRCSSWPTDRTPSQRPSGSPTQRSSCPGPRPRDPPRGFPGWTRACCAR